MNWNSTLGIISTLSFFLPVIIILVFQLFTRQAFLALLVYYLVSGIYNLIAQKLISTSAGFSYGLGIINNLLDAPLMLLFLVFFSSTSTMKKRIYITLAVFLIFEIIILMIYGFNVNTLRVVLAPDILIILVISFLFFVKNARLSITSHKNLGKAIMVSAILLAYSIFSLVYIYFYLLKNPDKNGAVLLYYLVSLLSAVLMSIGILIENKRIKKLNELKHTRKELAAIYGKANPA